MTTLQLTGLKAHHSLGFLAACGLLRCCDGSDDFHGVKLAWGAARGASTFTATVHFKDDDSDLKVLKERVIDRLVASADRVDKAHAFSWSKKIRVSRAKYCEASTEAICKRRRDDLAFFASYASDLLTSKKGDLVATAFDMTSARQEFLGLFRIIANSLGAVGKPLPLKDVDDAKDTQSPPPREAFEEALYGPWRYRDNVHSHGRDPTTQRLHALMATDPNVGRQKQGIPGVRAALFLATQALPLFPCFAVGGRLRTTAFHREDRDDWFAWPIWRDPISLDTLRSLLARPFSRDLKCRRVEVVYRCQRVRTGGSEGNYHVFSHAEQRPWPR